MRFLSLAEVLELHRRVMAQSGGSGGVRDLGALESVVTQSRMTFGGQELYETLSEKAVALGFSLISNHPFVDGNKRTGHAAMETFLILNGYEIDAGVDEAERMVLALAAGQAGREQLAVWLQGHLRPL